MPVEPLKSNQAIPPRSKPPLFSSLFFKLFFSLILFGVFPFAVVTLLLISGYESILREMAARLASIPNSFTSDLGEKFIRFQLQFRLVAGTLLTFMLAGSIVASRYLLKPTRELLRSLKQVRAGTLSVITTENDDEIGELADELNTTIQQFRLVMERDQALSKAKSEFISIVAHQLRTPLTALRWSLEGIRNNDIPEGEWRSITERNSKTVAQMIRLVGSLLDVVQIEEGRFGYTFKRAELWPLILKTVEDFTPQAKSQGIQFKILSPEREPPVFFDNDGIAIVLNNLISNALDYTPQGGTATISSRVQEATNQLEVSIADTGIGVPREEINLVFTKFFRASNARSIKPDGTGIGLFIAKSIIDRHGGTMRVESAPGKGSVFTFTLPLKEVDLPREEVSFEKFFSEFGEHAKETGVDKSK